MAPIGTNHGNAVRNLLTGHVREAQYRFHLSS